MGLQAVVELLVVLQVVVEVEDYDHHHPCC
jgi:hypothetical protein